MFLSATIPAGAGPGRNTDRYACILAWWSGFVQVLDSIIRSKEYDKIGWWVALHLCLRLCCVFITNVFPLFSFVILVPEGRDSNVKSNAKGKCTNEYAGHEDAVAFDQGIVEAVRKTHGMQAMKW